MNQACPDVIMIRGQASWCCTLPCRREPVKRSGDLPLSRCAGPATVWYQIFPEGFHNGNLSISPEKLAGWNRDEPTYSNFFDGDLEGIRLKLPYLKNLGINGIYLTPIFQSPSSHKYDTDDYFAIDQHFQSTADFKRLVSESHALYIRIMLDAVFNHVGFIHLFWQDILRNHECSEYKNYFHIHHFLVKEHYMDWRCGL